MSNANSDFKIRRLGLNGPTVGRQPQPLPEV